MKLLKNNKMKIALEFYRADPQGKLVVIARNEETTYFDHIKNMCKQAPPDGFKSGLNLGDLALRLAIIANIPDKNKVGDELLLEDAQHAELLAAYKNFTWTVADQQILDFDHWINNPEIVKAKKGSGK
jgi:hypothetical protein